MKINSIIAGVALTALAGSVQMAKANIIPYPDSGTLNATTYSFTANGGDVTAYFAGASAGDTDILGLYANNTYYWGNPTSLNNHTSNIGDSTDFGTFALGTTLVFVLKDGNNLYFSDPTLNDTDGVPIIFIPRVMMQMAVLVWTALFHPGRLLPSKICMGAAIKITTTSNSFLKMLHRAPPGRLLPSPNQTRLLLARCCCCLSV